jgi:hypothetical protein
LSIRKWLATGRCRVPEVLAVLPILIGAVGAGTSIYSLANQPGAPKPSTAPTVTPAQAATTKKNEEASLSQQFPGIQAATGGSLSPEAWARLAEILSGQAGTPGISSASQDLLSKISAGNTQSSVSTGPGLTTSTYG